jgi:hypothetical protein
MLEPIRMMARAIAMASGAIYIGKQVACHRPAPIPKISSDQAQLEGPATDLATVTVTVMRVNDMRLWAG